MLLKNKVKVFVFIVVLCLGTLYVSVTIRPLYDLGQQFIQSILFLSPKNGTADNTDRNKLSFYSGIVRKLTPPHKIPVITTTEIEKNIVQRVMRLKPNVEKTTRTVLSPYSGAVAHKTNVVPRIVHLTWFYPPGYGLKFHQYMSFLSFHKIVQPDSIYFWYNNEPAGQWWSRIRREVPEIRMKYREPPTSVLGKPVTIPEHQSDLVRLESILKYGGIYADLDVLALKSFDPFLKYDATMGHENPTELCGGIIIAKKNSPFIKLWFHKTKEVIKDEVWSYHAVRLPAEIAKEHRQWIHTEWDTMHKPSWEPEQRRWIFDIGMIYNWRRNYAMHLWYRFYKVEHNPEDIKTLNSTLGQMFRYIYYGSPDIIR